MVLYLNTKEIPTLKRALTFTTLYDSNDDKKIGESLLQRIEECYQKQKPTCKITITVETSE